MKSFSMLFRIERTLLKNNILSIVKNPKRVITYVLYIALMTWVILNNAKNFSSGIYFYQLETRSFKQVNKMILLQ